MTTTFQIGFSSSVMVLGFCSLSPSFLLLHWWPAPESVVGRISVQFCSLSWRPILIFIYPTLTFLYIFPNSPTHQSMSSYKIFFKPKGNMMIDHLFLIKYGKFFISITLYPCPFIIITIWNLSRGSYANYHFLQYTKCIWLATKHDKRPSYVLLRLVTTK